MKIYQLENEDMTNAGGPMGSSTSTRWRKYFISPQRAKQFAEDDYSKEIKREPIKWLRFFPRRGETGWSSGDLGWVCYTITPLKIEDEE